MAEEKSQLDWNKIKKFSQTVSIDIGAAMIEAAKRNVVDLAVSLFCRGAGSVHARRESRLHLR